MKIVSCTILHYGSEWLHYALKSVADQVDEMHIFYTKTPSHGHQTVLQNPDDRRKLYSKVLPFWNGNYKLGWHDCGPFVHEGFHREYAVEMCREMKADIVLVLDADELWDSVVLANAIEAVKNDNTARSYRIGMRHFWRSVKWVCDDPSMPTRFIKVNAPRNFHELYIGGKVFHMGYAQSPEIIRYKESIHGHKGEWRQDWFDNIFMPWKPGDMDVHPTNVNYWFPKVYENDGLDRLIIDHPYANGDIIR